jgi:hypothetical protein
MRARERGDFALSPRQQRGRNRASESGHSPVGHGDVENGLLLSIARGHIGLFDLDVLPEPAVPHRVPGVYVSDDDPLEAAFRLVGTGAQSRVHLLDFLLLAVGRGVGRSCLDVVDNVDFGGVGGCWDRCGHALCGEAGEHGHGDDLLELHCCGFCV